MIPIAQGKFSKPRQPRRENEQIPEYIPPIQEPTPAPVPDPSLEETILLTTAFEPIRESQAAAPVTQNTMTFEEAEFIQQTTIINPDETAAVQQLPDEEYDYEQELRHRKKEAARRRAKNRKILLISLCAVSLLLLITIIAGVMIFIKSNKDDGLILNNVTVAGVNVGGMTPEEAAAAIHRATDLTYTVENMVVYLPDIILELSPKDTGAKLDVVAAVEAAYNYGRTGTAEENRQAKADALVSNHTIALLPYLSLDTDYIRSVLEEYGESFNSVFEESSWELEGKMPELAGDKFDEKAKPQTLILNPGMPGRNVDIQDIYNDVLDAYSMNEFEVKTKMTDEEQMPEPLGRDEIKEIYEMLHTEAVDASMDMETFEVTSETYGYTFDLEKVLDMVPLTYGETVEIPMEYIIPKVLGKDLDGKLFADVLASVETPHTNDEKRNTNLKLACKAIHGLILMPGDTFDYNKVLGERTEEKGYKPAGALNGGNTTTEVGGGICQVSSTLYYATLLSDMEIVTRRSHSLPSTYMPMMGIDATVSWGGPDFRFKNNTNYPVRIEAEVSGGKVKVKLLGTDEKTYYVKMESKVVDSKKPEIVEETYTAAEAKAKGYKDGQVKQEGVTGYTVYSYKCKYDKETNKLISRDYEATSSYTKKDKIVIVVLPEVTVPPTTEAPPATTTPPATNPPVPETTTPPATNPPATEAPAAEPQPTEPNVDGIAETNP